MNPYGVAQRASGPPWRARDDLRFAAICAYAGGPDAFCDAREQLPSLSAAAACQQAVLYAPNNGILAGAARNAYYPAVNKTHAL